MTSALSPAGSTSRWRRVRLYVLERDGWVCQVPVDDAGRPVDTGTPHGVALTTHDPRLATHATVDHVVERAAWPPDTPGVDDSANLRAACRVCNGRRSAARTNAAPRVVTTRPWP